MNAASRRFINAAVLLTLAFALPLIGLVRLALKAEIQSHILLIPFVFLYLLKIASRPASSFIPKSAIPFVFLYFLKSAPKRTESATSRSIPGAVVAAIVGLCALAAYWIWGKSGRMTHNDALSLSTLSYLAFLLAAALLTLGWQTLRPRLFAIGFLVFMIPLPQGLIESLSVLLQRMSADAAAFLLSLTGMPFFQEGQAFQFPGLSIRVAEECSGVRSTFVLFITSLLAGHLFLRTGWKKALLALTIFPLGILRNAFRITAISWLSVNVDRGIIDGPLHHQGGPLFFLLSLVPLFALLWVLRRSDFRRTKAGSGPSSLAVEKKAG